MITLKMISSNGSLRTCEVDTIVDLVRATHGIKAMWSAEIGTGKVSSMRGSDNLIGKHCAVEAYRAILNKQISLWHRSTGIPEAALKMSDCDFAGSRVITPKKQAVGKPLYVKPCRKDVGCQVFVRDRNTEAWRGPLPLDAVLPAHYPYRYVTCTESTLNSENKSVSMWRQARMFRSERDARMQPIIDAYSQGTYGNPPPGYFIVSCGKTFNVERGDLCRSKVSGKWKQAPSWLVGYPVLSKRIARLVPPPQRGWARTPAGIRMSPGDMKFNLYSCCWEEVKFTETSDGLKYAKKLIKPIDPDESTIIEG
jgi:hypothetical protein